MESLELLKKIVWIVFSGLLVVVLEFMLASCRPTTEEEKGNTDCNRGKAYRGRKGEDGNGQGRPQYRGILGHSYLLCFIFRI